MVVVEASAAAHGIGQAQLGADFLEETAGKSAAENFVHHRQRGHVGIVAVRAQAHDLNVGLVHVFLVDEVEAGFGTVEDVVAGGQGLDRRQPFKGCAQLGFHGHGVEVAADADDELAADGAVVPGLEIVDGDRADGGQLRLAGVGAVGAVDQLGRLAVGDFVFVVVAADDAGGFLLLGQCGAFPR